MSRRTTAPAARPRAGARRRRRPESTEASARVHRKRSRDACPERARMLDPDHEAFVAWFVQYWSQRGASLFERKPTGKEA